MRMFIVDETMNDNEWMIHPTEEGYKVLGKRPHGSYNIVPARLLGMTYPDYLLYVRDKYGAILEGKAGYTHCIFKDKSKCAAAVEEMNSYWYKYEKELTKLWAEV